MKQRIKLGALLSNVKEFEVKGKKVKRKLVSIGLGNKAKNTQYSTTVELIVRDSGGKVLHQQTDGFINLVDPRTQPDELLELNIISPEEHKKRKESVKGLSESVRYVLEISK